MDGKGRDQVEARSHNDDERIILGDEIPVEENIVVDVGEESQIDNMLDVGDDSIGGDSNTGGVGNSEGMDGGINDGSNDDNAVDAVGDGSVAGVGGVSGAGAVGGVSGAGAVDDGIAAGAAAVADTAAAASDVNGVGATATDGSSHWLDGLVQPRIDGINDPVQIMLDMATYFENRFELLIDEQNRMYSQNLGLFNHELALELQDGLTNILRYMHLRGHEPNSVASIVGNADNYGRVLIGIYNESARRIRQLNIMNDQGDEENASNGLSEHMINSIPIIVFQHIETETCCICLGDNKIGEQGRDLRCKHQLHLECIDSWLKTANSCPLCRQQALNQESD